MFHLIDECIHDSPTDVLSDLSAITQALSYGFDGDAVENPEARHGFAMIATAISRSLIDLVPIVSKQIEPYRAQQRAERQARHGNGQPAAQPDLTEPVGYEAPSLEELRAEAEREGRAYEAARERRRAARAG